MKTMYIQPQSSIEELMPTTIICASVGQGDDVPDPGPSGDPMFGD